VSPDRDLRERSLLGIGTRHATLIGLLVGMALGFAGAFGGFVDFLIVAVLSALGVAVGLVIDGRIDLSGLIDRDRHDR
jgi:ABC-type Mn2+/Zn2+ transport system permease subunit